MKQQPSWPRVISSLLIATVVPIAALTTLTNASNPDVGLVFWIVVGAAAWGWMIAP